MGVLELLNKLFYGLGQESLKIELLGILRDLAWEDPNDPSVQSTINDICNSIVVLLTKHGRSYSVDACVNDVKKALEEDRARMISRVVIEKLRRSRGRGSRTSRTEELI